MSQEKESGQRREREEEEEVKIDAPAKRYEKNCTSYIRVGCLFRQGPNGEPEGICVRNGCDIHCRQDPMPRNCKCPDFKKWKLVNGQIYVLKPVKVEYTEVVS